MSRIFLDSTFKLYKSNNIPKELTPAQIEELRILVSKLVFENLEKSASSLIYDDLITYNNWKDIENELTISFKASNKKIQDHDYDLAYLIIKHQNKQILPRQIVIFLNKSNPPVNDLEFNNLILIKGQSGISQLVIDFFEDMTIIIKSLKLNNEIIVNCLNKIIKSHNKQNHISSIGDLEINFSINTLNNSLNHLSISLPNRDIKSFIEDGQNDGEEGNLINKLYDHINKQTSMDLNKLNIHKISCGVLLIASDGKLKLLSGGLDLSGQNSTDSMVVYEILTDIYDSKYN